jgi:hypothetical protein
MNQEHRSAALAMFGLMNALERRAGSGAEPRPGEDLMHWLGSANAIDRRCTPLPAIAGAARKTLKTSSRDSLPTSLNGVPC